MSPVPLTTIVGNFSLQQTSGQSSDAAFSDEVALAALVLGGGAFVIAFLQMFYQ